MSVLAIIEKSAELLLELGLAAAKAKEMTWAQIEARARAMGFEIEKHIEEDKIGDEEAHAKARGQLGQS